VQEDEVEDDDACGLGVDDVPADPGCYHEEGGADDAEEAAAQTLACGGLHADGGHDLGPEEPVLGVEDLGVS
jgi:hypothetical protein